MINAELTKPHMHNITQSALWQALQLHYAATRSLHMRYLFKQDPQRFERFSLCAAGVCLDYSKNRITAETMDLLLQLAASTQVREHIEALFTGKELNVSEKRPALHTALRNQSNKSVIVAGQDIMPEIKATLERMRNFSNAVRNHTWLGFSGLPITDIVNIGIGGSDLGPAMVTEALAPYASSSLRCHFISTIDGNQISTTLKKLQPAQTLFVISSKSFGTQETLANATLAKQWISDAAGTQQNIDQHFVAVTAHPHRAHAFGIPEQLIFPIWEWVSGRYSVWSAIGLPIILSIGMERFEEFLAGAYEMDQHFRTAPLQSNMPVILALLGIWYINFYGAQSLAILPYDYSLRRLIAYLQQADMESNGKSIRQDGSATHYATAPIIWGEIGTNGQHAFHQLLHQGTHLAPADFIIACQHHHELNEHHALLFANCLSQSQAFMQGKTYDEALAECLQAGLNQTDAQQLAAQKIIPGNRPNNTLVLPKLTPHALGALLALYEHKIFVQGVIWGINSFDQWGVELGKQLATAILPLLDQSISNDAIDASTQGLIRFYQSQRQGNT